MTSSQTISDLEQKLIEESIAYLKEKKIAEASQKALEVIKSNPLNIKALEVMALCAERIKSYDSALNLFLSIKELKPRHHIIDLYIGHMLIELERYDEALSYLTPLQKIETKNDTLQFLLGLAHMYKGDKDKMHAHLKKSLTLNPLNIDALYTYITNAKVVTSHDSPYLKGILKLKEQDNTDTLNNERTQILLYFSLYKAYEDLEDYDTAFDYLLKATKLKRKDIPYNSNSAKKYFSDIKAFFTEDFIKEFDISTSCKSDRPVFILGMPRSGTTLLEQVLHAHPDIEGIGESPVLDMLIREYSYIPPHNDAKYPLRVIQKHKKVFSVQQIGEKYCDYLDKVSPISKRVINKSITNFHWFAYILLSIPNAHFIHVTRSPMDSCLSTFTKNFADTTQGFSYDLTEMGEYYREYHALMAYWESIVPGRIIHISYESMVEDLEYEAKRVIKALGLDWSPACLEFHNARKDVRTASAMQVRQPIHKKSISRWKKYEKQLQPLVEALGDLAKE